ncbi:DUF3667 domain-containing protein [Winogradskyella litorisediminis]|uniref:DUF3667 domain-containing protein n=1 Tax=Winogradskyella litorisediminis TaxID=1156618 RepID=A0ABW3N4N7_9FLAO
MKTEIDCCQNCEEPLEGDFKFCPNCGQKTNEELTLGVLFYNTISNYFSFDARFLKSFIPLMFKPGYLAKKFLEGKRLLYLHPAQMYLFVSVIFFFIFSFTVNDWIKEANNANAAIVKPNEIDRLNNAYEKALDTIVKMSQLRDEKTNGKSTQLSENETQKVIDSILKSVKSNQNGNSINFGISKKKLDSLRNAGVDNNIIYKEMGMDDDAGFITRGFYKTMLDLADGQGVGILIKRFADTIPIAMFFLLPIFAFLLKIFYFNRGRYAHHLVFSFYFFSFLFTVFSILLATNEIFDVIPWYVNLLIALSTFIYFYLAVLHFYNSHWFTTFIKANVITFIFLMMVIPFAAGIITVVAFVNA